MIDKNVVTFVPLLHFHWCSHLQTLTEWWADLSKLTPMMNVVTPSMILFFQGSFKTKLAWACIFLLIFQCWADVPASGRPACPSRGFPGQRACTHSRCSVGRRPGGEGSGNNSFLLMFSLLYQARQNTATQQNVSQVLPEVKTKKQRNTSKKMNKTRSP